MLLQVNPAHLRKGKLKVVPLGQEREGEKALLTLTWKENLERRTDCNRTLQMPIRVWIPHQICPPRFVAIAVSLFYKLNSQGIQFCRHFQHYLSQRLAKLIISKYASVTIDGGGSYLVFITIRQIQQLTWRS